MLKYENTAEIGDVIKAFDFQPMPDRPDVYMTGRVISKGPVKHPVEGFYMFDGYTIEITDADDKTRDERVGDVGYVPFECAFMDYDERVQVLEAA